MGDWDNFFGDTEGFSEVLNTFNFNVVVIMVPVVDKFDEVSGEERSQEHPSVEIGDSSVLMFLLGKIFFNDDDSFSKKVFIDGSLSFLSD